MQNGYIRHITQTQIESVDDGEYSINGAQKNLISIAFKNTGTVDVNVNGFVLAPGDPMLSFGGESFALDNSVYTVGFNGVGGACKVIYKYLVRTEFVEVTAVCRDNKSGKK